MYTLEYLTDRQIEDGEIDTLTIDVAIRHQFYANLTGKICLWDYDYDQYVESLNL